MQCHCQRSKNQKNPNPATGGMSWILLSSMDKSNSNNKSRSSSKTSMVKRMIITIRRTTKATSPSYLQASTKIWWLTCYNSWQWTPKTCKACSVLMTQTQPQWCRTSRTLQCRWVPCQVQTSSSRANRTTILTTLRRTMRLRKDKLARKWL